MPWGPKCFRKNFKKGSFDWKFKGLVVFLIVESDWRATKPSLGAYKVGIEIFVIKTSKRAHSIGN
jgi:hypothetical protein